MELEFFGAAREVTGSCHILRVGRKTVLLDCGLFQGRRKETHEKNLHLPVPAAAVDAVILSHAHIDHSGRLPLLVKQGFTGTIYCTPATRDLCAIMLADSAHIQEKDAEYLTRHRREVEHALYGAADVAPTLRRMVGVPYDTPVDVVPGLRATFVDAGHILGSASLVLECEEGARRSRIVYSGDIGRRGLPIIGDPQPPQGADGVILESTYGNRDHEPVEDMREQLGRIVRETAARGGRVIIPAFAVGRTQEIVYDLHALAHAGRIPAISIFVDSPLAVDATTVFAMHPEIFDAAERLASDPDLFRFPLLHYTRDVTESKALNARRDPLIVISASGMAESGRILHHLANGAPDPRNCILIVGFQAEHTLGRRIVERRPMLRILGEDVPLRARVEVLNGYSAHADRAELRQWLDAVRGDAARPPRVWLVHGETAAQDSMAAELRGAGYEVECPAPYERAELPRA